MAKRLTLLQDHLVSKFGTVPVDVSLDNYRSRGLNFDARKLLKAVEGEHLELSEQIGAVLTEDGQTPLDLIRMSTNEQREYILELILRFKKSGLFTKARDDNEPGSSSAIMTALSAFDVASAVRFTVHISLYADTLRVLGTSKHAVLLERVFTVEDYGCFALTELGHGSNASGVETVATYLHSTRQFELNSPTHTSAKWWIGAAAKTANKAVVFAQLVVEGVKQGVHVFCVSIRDATTHEVLPGVVLGDCGPKAGLNGIDNGFIIFKRYRVDYDSLLDKLGQVTTDGKYTSPIQAKEKRFAFMLAGLSRGRVTMVKGPEYILRNAVTVAVRYSAVRKQFGKKHQPENSILDYPLHRYRLAIHLARTVALSIVSQRMFSLYSDSRDRVIADPNINEISELHAFISALKPLSSWWARDGVQECREACGGHGYSAFSMFSRWRDNNDVILTWEGDNNVLIQQAARFVLKEAQKGSPISTSYLTYLNSDGDRVRSQRADLSARGGLTLELALEMAHYRVNLLLHKSLSRMQYYANTGDLALAWNASQPLYLNELGKAFGEAIILEDIREHDYLTGEQGTWLQNHVIELSEGVGESSVRIVDAIAWNDKIIGSVLGQNDGQVYRHMIDAVEHSEGCYDQPTWLPLLREVRKST